MAGRVKKTSKINTEYLSPGEFFDRFTIIIRKARFEKSYEGRLIEYLAIMKKNSLPSELLKNICILMMANTDIWNLESDIRMGKTPELGLKEVGERAIAIRNINRKRIQAVNRLNELFGDPRKETKFEHASE